MRRKIKKFFYLLPLMLAWLVLSAIFWGWIFTIVTNVPQSERIVISVSAPVSDSTAMAVELEEKKPTGIKRVRVLPFSYGIMSTSELEQADLFIICERDMNELLDWLNPLPKSLTTLLPEEQTEFRDYGILLSGDLPYEQYIYYEKINEQLPFRYYLCPGKKGGHLEPEKGEPDEALLYYIDLLLNNGLNES